MSPASTSRTAPRSRSRAMRRFLRYPLSSASPPRPSSSAMPPCRSLVPTTDSVRDAEAGGDWGALSGCRCHGADDPLATRLAVSASAVANVSRGFIGREEYRGKYEVRRPGTTRGRGTSYFLLSSGCYTALEDHVAGEPFAEAFQRHARCLGGLLENRSGLLVER